MKELSLLSSEAKVSSRSILSDARKDMMREVVWALTCGRSWLTGEPVIFDDAVLHHILHDPTTGKTLYGAAYESSLENFAMLTQRQNIVDVEKSGERQRCQTLFNYMWQKFKEGDFEAATDHWNKYDRQRQLDFLRERRSNRYLDYWLSIIRGGI